jgi:hypothetical protein
MLGSSGAKAGLVASEPSAVCRSPVTAPSDRRRSSSPSGSEDSSSSASSQPSRAPREVLLEDAERGVDQAALELVPARERGDVGELVRGEEAQQLELRVLPRLDAAEGLEDQLLPEYHGRVGLLDPDGAHVDGAPEADGRGVRPMELEHAVLDGDLVLRAHAVQQLAPAGRVAERVVDRPAVDLEDHPLAPVLRRRPQAKGQLVHLVRAGLEARLDEREHEQRRLGAQRRRFEHIEVRDLARLGREPALAHHPVVQLALGQEGEVARGDRLAQISHRRPPAPRPRSAGTSRSRAERA